MLQTKEMPIWKTKKEMGITE